MFMSGVLQGCPGSAFLFNKSIDPFLFDFEETIAKQIMDLSGPAPTTLE